eukprot:TRINITY_DN6765_c0_g2_i1.p1 TRINITY_DN6765_c0_g2~~TRINITY_DN6765_c0_g2_i1.p1  ORF type:complete len:120 (+),score=23.57 TRINITY_DN6765_c0_g2_i1:47-361(+)
MVALLEKQLKTKAILHYEQMPRNGDVPFTHANISRAYRDLGYSPGTDLKTGMKAFVKWYLSHYGVQGRSGRRQHEEGFEHTHASTRNEKERKAGEKSSIDLQQQ